jgi:hypothetical protein
VAQNACTHGNSCGICFRDYDIGAGAKFNTILHRVRSSSAFGPNICWTAEESVPPTEKKNVLLQNCDHGNVSDCVSGRCFAERSQVTWHIPIMPVDILTFEAQNAVLIHTSYSLRSPTPLTDDRTFLSKKTSRCGNSVSRITESLIRKSRVLTENW